MRSLLCAGIALWSACGHAPVAPVAEPPPADALVLPPALSAARATLLLGDLHGTRELPAFVGRIVTSLAATQPVVLGLEIPSDQVPSLPAFLTSDGGPAARAAVLIDPWWQAAYQDGRRSVAMLELVDTARRLRAAGKQIDIACFDAQLPAPVDPVQREAIMARNLVALRAARPDAILVVYAGNLHVSRAQPDRDPGYPWMAMQMASAGLAFTSLGPRWGAGSAWICTTDKAAECGARPMGGGHHPPGIELAPSSDGQYDGWFDVGAITASPPAAGPR